MRLIFGMLLLLTAPAWAGNTVDLDLPLPPDNVDYRKPFVAKGAGDGATVDLLFVRTGLPAFGVQREAGRLDCDQLGAQLASGVDPDRLPALRGRISRIDAVVDGGGLEAWRGRPVLVAGRWERSEGDATGWSVVVDSRAFFRPGSTFCAIAVHHGRSASEQRALRDAVVQAVPALSAARTARDGAREAAIRDELKARAVDFTKANAEAGAEAWAAALKLLDPGFYDKPRAIRVRAGQAAVALSARPLDGLDSAAAALLISAQPLSTDLETSPLGALIAELLVRAGALDRLPGGPRYVDPATGDAVRAVSAVLRGERITELRLHRERGPALRVQPALDLPGVDVPLTDLLLLAIGRLPTAAGSVPLAQLADPSSAEGAVWAVPEGEVSPPVTPELLAQGRFWTGISDAIAFSSVAASDELRQDTDTWKLLGRWLGGAGSQFVQPNLSRSERACPADLPGPCLLGDLSAAVIDATRDAQRWEAGKAQLVVTVRRIALEVRTTLPLSTRAAGQKQWIDQHLTPQVGIASIWFDGRFRPAPTLMLSVHPFANPVDEPMWSNGSQDLSRLFAGQVGVILPASETFSLNADPRIALPPRAPPALFAGLQLQFAPYVSASIGGAFFFALSTSHPNERPRVAAAPYLSLNVELNFLGTVRTLVSDAQN